METKDLEGGCQSSLPTEQCWDSLAASCALPQGRVPPRLQRVPENFCPAQCN